MLSEREEAENHAYQFIVNISFEFFLKKSFVRFYRNLAELLHMTWSIQKI